MEVKETSKELEAFEKSLEEMRELTRKGWLTYVEELEGLDLEDLFDEV